MPVFLQYNTCFWALVKSGKSKTEAQKALQVCLLPAFPSPRHCCYAHPCPAYFLVLTWFSHQKCMQRCTSGDTQGTQTEQKNELLYSSFGINYATLPASFRKVHLPLLSHCMPFCNK